MKRYANQNSGALYYICIAKWKRILCTKIALQKAWPCDAKKGQKVTIIDSKTYKGLYENE